MGYFDIDVIPKPEFNPCELRNMLIGFTLFFGGLSWVFLLMWCLHGH